MGVKGGRVRSLFPKNTLFWTHEHNERSNMGEKKRWTSVRSYLCGDETSSVLAEQDSGSIKGSEFDAVFKMSQPPDAFEDSASALVKPLDSVLALQDLASGKSLDSASQQDQSSASVNSSEATVTQLAQNKTADKENSQSEATETRIQKKHQTSVSKLIKEEDAAIIIQSSFKSFLATRPNKAQSPSKESMATSLEVQTSNSVKAFSFGGQDASASNRIQWKTKTQVLRAKEDWDDSTVSSTISKMRTQNRLEAMTRRERALAYAFSQQLRVCSKKKQTEYNEFEHNMGWSWLERWMATRVPDSISVEHSTNNKPDAGKQCQELTIKKRLFAVAGELESCRSNNVSVQLESMSVTTQENADLKPGKKNLKSTRNISTPKPLPSYDIQRGCAKLQATRKDLQRETNKAKKANSTPPCCKRESQCKEAEVSH